MLQALIIVIYLIITFVGLYGMMFSPSGWIGMVGLTPTAWSMIPLIASGVLVTALLLASTETFRQVSNPVLKWLARIAVTAVLSGVAFGLAFALAMFITFGLVKW